MTSASLTAQHAHAEAPPIVYVGPTLSSSMIQELLPGAHIRPPIARGELYRDRESGGAVFVIIDGMFTQHLAISPREVVDVARDKALVIGASSMGALRAAECWPVGVQGVGLVYRLFRRGILESDGEVAVGTDQDHEFRAVSVALVNVRYAVSRAIRQRLLERQSGQRIVDAAARIFYPERQWRSVLREARVADDSRQLARFCAAQDIKRLDGIQALQYVSRLLRQGDRLTKHRQTTDAPFLRPNREAFQPYLGSSPDVLRGELVEWLFGTGRYQRYLWALLAGRTDFHGLPQQGRAERLREVLCDVLSDLLPHDDAFAHAVWEELAFLGELQAEITRMYAAKRLAQDATRASVVVEQHVLHRVREEVSIAHGACSWSLLLEHVIDGRLCGAIPFAWIERSCSIIAQARSLVQHMG